MKKTKLLFIILIILNCKSQETRFITKTLINNEGNPICEKLEKLEKFDEFNGIIENFEKKLEYWSYNHKNNTFLEKTVFSNINVGKFIFSAPYSHEEFHPNINYIFYNRKMDFSKYKGIRFIAKGGNSILYKIKIFEKEDYYKGEKVNETWYKTFEVQGNWKEYKILFNEMQVEEYWEQDYISDNIQIFTNIVGISITAQNISSRNDIKGTLYIDNIELY